MMRLPTPISTLRCPPSRRSLAAAAWLCLAAVAPAVSAAPEPAEARAAPYFHDASAETGLDFVHFNGMSGELYFPEMTGAGGAMLDYDGDGDLDLYLVQGAMLPPGRPLAEALAPPRGPLPPSDRLLRNDLVFGPAGRPVPRFVDVTERAGLTARGYGMGVAVGDYDGDGDVDLFVTNYGPNELWRNEGDGTFREVTAEAGLRPARAEGAIPEWGTSAAFFDADADGRLDLYVVNYVDFDLVANPRCYSRSSRRDYCGPADFAPQADRFYRNAGGGRFEEVTRWALIDYRPGPGLGVIATDLTGDGRADVYVANDGAANQLWVNQGDGTFRDEALLAGLAVNREGRAEASMGVDAGDFDADGDEDLFLTHLMGETNTLYVNEGSGFFEDRTVEARLGPESLPFTSFGTAWIDFDNDSLLDLLVLNGAVRILEEQAVAGEIFPLRQPNQLMRNLDGRRFEEVTERAGAAFRVSEVSRGAALGDVDNDGDADVLVLNNNGPARLLLDRAADGTPWLGLRAVGGGSAGELTDVRFLVRREERPPLLRRARSDGSYCSAHDSRVVVGLAGGPPPQSVRIEPPAGGRLELRSPLTGRYLTFPMPAREEGA